MPQRAAAADVTRCATRLRTRCGPLVSAMVLAAIGIVLDLATPIALHADPGKDQWIGKRVILRSTGFLLLADARLIHPRRFDIYRVEKVDGPRLWLQGEREGYSGWTRAADVVAVSQALKFFSDEIRANPDDPNGYTLRAIFLERERKEFDQALADYNEVIRLDPTKPYGYNNRGKLWFAKNEFDRAIADYTEAIRRDPNETVAYNNRGSAWLAKKEYDKAMADFDEAQRLDPTYGAVGFNRIYVLFAARRDGVVEASQRLLELKGWRGFHSTYVVIMGHLGALRSHQSGQAKTFLDDAAALCDRSAWPYPVVRYLRGEIDEAQVLAAANDNGKMTEAHFYLGLKLIQQKQEKAALPHLLWVTDNGDPSFLEYKVALIEVDRLTGK
jgi:lipoprotein NlpI